MIISIIGFLLLLAFSFSQDYVKTKIISVEKKPETIEKLKGMSLDFLMEWDNKIYINTNLNDQFKLRSKKVPFVFEPLDYFPDMQKTFSLQSGINGQYHSYQEVETELLGLEESYPLLAKVYDIGDSLENRNIYALKISDNVQTDEDEAEVIFLGCHHAREWISVEVPLLLGKYLAENYETDIGIKDLVDRSEIWIIPIVNPDGLEYSIHFYRYWRKNRRNNGDGTYGVDINRNYGYKWGLDNSGSSPNPDSSVYRGKSAFSEPETQAVRDLFVENDFRAMISYHSYSQVVLYPWGYTLIPTEHDGLFSSIAKEMTSRMQQANGRTYEYGQAGDSLYFTNGDTTDWTYGIYGIPSFTIELPPIDQIHGGFFNAEKDIQTIFAENLPAALYLIEWAIQQENLIQNIRIQKNRLHILDKERIK